eukprot:17678-Heterococcus_DN1.PRE.3
MVASKQRDGHTVKLELPRDGAFSSLAIILASMPWKPNNQSFISALWHTLPQATSNCATVALHGVLLQPAVPLALPLSKCLQLHCERCRQRICCALFCERTATTTMLLLLLHAVKARVAAAAAAATAKAVDCSLLVSVCCTLHDTLLSSSYICCCERCYFSSAVATLTTAVFQRIQLRISTAAATA